MGGRQIPAEHHGHLEASCSCMGQVICNEHGPLGVAHDAMKRPVLRYICIQVIHRRSCDFRVCGWIVFTPRGVPDPETLHQEARVSEGWVGTRDVATNIAGSEEHAAGRELCGGGW